MSYEIIYYNTANLKQHTGLLQAKKNSTANHRQASSGPRPLGPRAPTVSAGAARRPPSARVSLGGAVHPNREEGPGDCQWEFQTHWSEAGQWEGLPAHEPAGKAPGVGLRLCAAGQPGQVINYTVHESVAPLSLI